MHASGQHRVEVRHQPYVRAIEAAQVLEAVAEPHALLEVLLEIRNAAGKRRAARIDDARPGQHQVDEPGMHPVARHFVDEKGASEEAMRGGLFKVTLPECTQLCSAELGERLRVGAR